MILLVLTQRLFNIISLCLLGAGGYLVWSWWEREQDVRAIDPDLDPSNARLYVGLALLAWSFLGRLPILALAAKPRRDHDRFVRAEGRMVVSPDGAKIRTESYGPSNAPCLILTHGWGMNSTIWIEAKRQLARRYRLVVWDLPGLGRSSQPADRAYSLDRFAADLRSVVADNAANGPVLLVGHSIGGMTVQTFCRNYSEMLGANVAGIVLENTTHTNPVRTMVLAGLLRAIQKPVLEPLMKLDILLSPILWLMNWHGYLSGSNHLAARLAGFGSRPTASQLDQTARLMAEGSPAVQAKGNLAMMHWSVTDALSAIRVPALVFIGRRDIITLPEAGQQIANAIPQASVISIDEAGHMGPVECALDYNRAIETFADEVLMSGALHADRRPSPMADSNAGQPNDTVAQPGEPTPRII